MTAAGDEAGPVRRASSAAPRPRRAATTWNIFGKTGTAHISQGKGGYSDDEVHQQLHRRRPAENPRLVVALIIHEPRQRASPTTAAPSPPPAPGPAAHARCAYLQVPASPDLPPPPPRVANVLCELRTPRSTSASRWREARVGKYVALRPAQVFSFKPTGKELAARVRLSHDSAIPHVTRSTSRRRN